jgi:hypothetical protein
MMLISIDIEPVELIRTCCGSGRACLFGDKILLTLSVYRKKAMYRKDYKFTLWQLAVRSENHSSFPLHKREERNK